MHVGGLEHRRDAGAHVAVVECIGANERGRHPIECVRRRHVHVARHHRRRDRPGVVQGDTRAAELAALVVAEADAAPSPLVLGTEPLRRDATDRVVRSDPVADLLQRPALDLGEITFLEGDTGVADRAEQGVPESLVSDRARPNFGRGADVLAHVLDELVLELVVRDPDDLEIEVEVGPLDVEEPADADDPAEVAR